MKIKLKKRLLNSSNLFLNISTTISEQLLGKINHINKNYTQTYNYTHY
jgi:hypothetical protein